jgi:uncharacterized membrane protein
MTNLGVMLAHATPSVLAAFLGALVEFTEALTIILAVGTVRGWRGALSGSATALAVLISLVWLLGPALTRIPVAPLQLVFGILMLLFGLRWLRKAVLRSAGVIPLRDEGAAFARETEAMRNTAIGGDWDGLAFTTAFQISLLEGSEVVFIVVAVGAGGAGLLLPASLGALSALLVVTALGVVLHRPLARVPENNLKFGVGVLLSAFGTFLAGEAMGVGWPGNDWSVLTLSAGFMAASSLAVLVCRHAR